MILAKFLTKISPKMQNLDQSDPYNFSYSLLALNFCQKVFTKMHDSTFKNNRIFQLLRGYPLKHPLCIQTGICHYDTKNKTINNNNKNSKRWLGGTRNFEVWDEFREGFGRQHLALGNNSDFLEE